MPSQRWIDLAEQQRRAVADAAVDLAAAGHIPLKVADLADGAGITRPTFLLLFPPRSGQQCCTRRARAVLAELNAYVEPRLPAGENGREKLLVWPALLRICPRTPRDDEIFQLLRLLVSETGLHLAMKMPSVG